LLIVLHYVRKNRLKDRKIYTNVNNYLFVYEL
jgi:hypothetical protein